MGPPAFILDAPFKIGTYFSPLKWLPSRGVFVIIDDEEA